MSDEPITSCPDCMGAVHKIFSAAGIVFKGTGFHNTDYGTGLQGNSGKNAKAEKDQGAGPAKKNDGNKKST
jgi:predicted nucleic acid-binding Zn ribbon protein